MPTPEWRYEKAANVVRSLCEMLQMAPSEEQRSEIGSALFDALKLLCDAITEGNPERGDLWTPGLVRLFYDNPSHCKEWLELMDEPDFKPTYYDRQ